jgi:uncharacterized protein (TIGR00266 family)
MSQWYFSYDGKQEGPYDISKARTIAKDNSNGFAWKEGYAEWLPISKIDFLSETAAPPPQNRKSADEIDYKIMGTEMQFVEIELDPGESVVAEAGGMMYKDPSVGMQSIFGDGSKKDEGASFVNKLVGAGKRLITGESLFITVFTHNGQNKAKISFAAPYPGNIIPIHLNNVNGYLVCQKDSFLAAAKGVSIGIHFQKKILTGLFGGEGFIMQKLEGDGLVFMHAGGTVVEKTLAAGEALHCDTGCVVGFESSVNFDIEQAGNIKSMMFGGEGIFFANLKGPGKVWLQSLPFSRLAGRMLQARSQHKGEGSALGGLAGLLDGDNF